MRALVIYHGGCRDGFCAAWVLARELSEADFHEGFYGQPPPDCTGRDVVIVDFSYPLIDMERMAAQAKTLLVLDHHVTARDALSTFRAPNATVVFDMTRSGAGLAWDHCHHGDMRPWLVDYVEDRDLWRMALHEPAAVNAYIGTIPFEFEAWDRASEGTIDEAILSGRAVEAKIHQYIKEVRKNAERITFEGFDVPIVNAPQVDISELVGFMANGETFAMGWWRGHGVFNYSLRSKGDFDVSELAKRHGGGGHKNAAGFQLPGLLSELKVAP
jgi:oligoribonuclease NrnB/cAMP/cGMP phosphodiesterase (DHH superfamily)